jgi:hypothetical protein
MKQENIIRNIELKIKDSPDFYDGCFELKKNKGFDTIWFCGLAVLRFQDKKDKTLLGVPEKYYSLFGLADRITIIKQQANWNTIELDNEIGNTILQEADVVFRQSFKDSASDVFGCCSRYEECSNEKLCVHPEKEMARGCMYKINLDNGRIFYGANRNID